MCKWPTGKTLGSSVQSRGFESIATHNSTFLRWAPRPHLLQLSSFCCPPCGFCGTIGWHCRHCGLSGAAYEMFKSISPSIQFQVLGTPKKIPTRCPVRWSRWTSTQFRLGYAGRSLLGFGPRVARVLNYASCTLDRDAEGYLAGPSHRDYLLFG